MTTPTPEHPALTAVRKSGSQKVKVAVSDIDGILRGKYLHIDKFLGAAEPSPGGGFGFCDVVLGWDMTDTCYDNSSLTGWQHGFPDALARIDLATYRQVPWDGGVPFFLGEFVNADGTPSPICPRQTLKRVLRRAEKLGLLVMTGMAGVLLAWLHGRPALRRFAAWRRPEAALLRRMAGLGLPVTGTFAVETGLFLAISLLIGQLGAAPLAAHQIALSIASVSFMIPLAIGQAANVRVGNRVGAGDAAGARRAGLVAIGLGAAAEAVAVAVLLLAPGTLAGLYIDPALPANAEALATAMTLIGIAAAFQVADGMQAVAAGALRGLGDTRVPFGLAAVGYWGLGFPLAWWLTGPMGAGPAGAWWGLAASLLAVAVALTLRFLRQSGRLVS